MQTVFDAILASTMNKIDNTQVATKADIIRIENGLKKFSTKTELKNVEKSLRGEILRVEERVENVEDGLKDLKGEMHVVHKKLDKLQNTMDKFVGIVDDLRTENEVGTHQIKELDKRVTKLESSPRTA